MVYAPSLFLIQLISWLAIQPLRKRQLSRLSATTSSRFLWTMLRLPMEEVDRFSTGELVARYNSVRKATDAIEHMLPLTTLWIQPILCSWLLMLYNTKLALIEIGAMLILLFSMLDKRFSHDFSLNPSIPSISSLCSSR